MRQAREGGVSGVGGAAAGEVDDGGVGQGRLRTPYEPPFRTFLPKQESSQDETACDPRDGQTLELGTLSGREPRGVTPQTSDTAAPLPAPLSEKPHNDKPSGWKVLVLPCALCFDEQKTKPKKKREICVRRRPSTLPVLHPAHRYCYRDQIVKPYRTHHCRNCGTVSHCLL